MSAFTVTVNSRPIRRSEPARSFGRNHLLPLPQRLASGLDRIAQLRTEYIGGVLPRVAEDPYPYDQTGWASDESALGWAWERIGALAYRYIAEQPSTPDHFLDLSTSHSRWTHPQRTRHRPQPGKMAPWVLDFRPSASYAEFILAF